MGNGLDIASLAKAGENPETANSITGMLESVAKNLGYVEKIMGTLEKMGVSKAVLEKVIIKYADLDKVPDLKDATLVKPASGTHKMMFDALNQMNEQQLQELGKQMQEQGKEEPKKKGK